MTALEASYRADHTIVDANATTLIKMLILFAFCAGAIRGFALTISMGIILSMFTAIVLVRLLTSYWIQNKPPKSLQIGTRWHVLPEGTAIPFMKARYSGLIVSALLSLTSLGLGVLPRTDEGRSCGGWSAAAPGTMPNLRDKLGSLGRRKCANSVRLTTYWCGLNNPPSRARRRTRPSPKSATLLSRQFPAENLVVTSVNDRR